MSEKAKVCFCYRLKDQDKCQKIKVSEIKNCSRFHHTVLHKMNVLQPEDKTLTFTQRSMYSVNLKIISVEMRGQSGIVSNIAQLDDGRATTLIHKILVKRIGIQGPNSPTRCECKGGM